MNLASLLKQAEKFTNDNAPTILTALGAVGTVTTAVLTAKASFKSAEQIAEREFYIRTHPTTAAGTTDTLTRNEKIKLVWKNFILPAGTGAFTVTAIVSANQINSKRLAALAAAYSISEKRLDRYKDKVVEKIGEKKAELLGAEVSQERMKEQPVSQATVILAGGDVLCFDHFTGRYFKADMERLRRAENDTNYDIINVGYACLSDFYERLGLPATSMTEEFGWRAPDKLDLDIKTILTDDGRPCLAFDLNVMPIRDYQRCKGE